ncbi:MAG: hypothetical protein II745_00605, partial [Lachnospiraceae bacterium]|nr:hypothetical protein [Lachnospiraceae bacterium]
MISEDEAWARSRLGSLSPEELENPLLFDEEEEIYIQGPGQTFKVDDYVINGGLIMENYSRLDEARVIKSSKQFHLPSFRASLLKSNLVNSLELTEEKRKELLDDRNMELDDI